MPVKKDTSKEIQKLKQRISLLETENKHLRNELHLTVEEKETAKKDYFDIISNMEEKVEQRTRETKELQKISEAKGKELQFILDISPAMIFYKDTQQRYIRVNQAFAKTLGIPIKKIIGKTFSELFPDTPEQFLEDDLEVMKTGKPMLNIDSRVKTRKGWRDILVNKIPYKDIDGNIIGIIGFALDITDLKLVEKEKKDLEKRLTQMEKMDAIGRLAGGVAHDLNNVLSAVVSYPDLLLMKMSEDSPFRRSIITMQKAGQKAAAIVEDLLILARRGVPTTEVISLNDIINNYFNSPEFETLKRYNPQVEIKTDLEPDLLNIKGSPLHLTKTIMNLVSNAAEATLGKGTVTLATHNRYLEKPQRSYDLSIPIGEYVVLNVADTGEGIHSQDLKRIFEPFYTKKVMGRRGTGLGMAVVWGTVKYHKGNIEVNTIEGEGTTFELYFPVTREPLSKVKTFEPVKRYVGHNERILVVDDVQDQLEIITTLLTSLNYSVKTATSGEEAVEYLKTHTVDLVLLDMIMDPGMDGLDTYKKIIELHPGQKALITSGYSETERVKEAQRLGAGQYIKKPYSLEKIGLAVRAELDKK
ncbi:MAG: response regulator [Candidatus Aminicenantes bacterium]|nr:response regulator [Candidatus Aminicenantes bacterium]NIM83276.1 response regulator [Candidatus Aminicenantes bacterium]NIN22647.1 response regulator [Candidatus Aminicenantes bacterium]NIN46406.1 response regulator [Candidatus Aminicenantes bacterium]NIN89256.1 response regulator [Candidatus Aminicenantes bacterium]